MLFRWQKDALSGVSGRIFPHYFAAWLPMLALGAVVFAEALRIRGMGHRMALAILAIAMATQSVFEVYVQARTFRPENGLRLDDRDALVAYVEATTSPEQTVLVWGGPPEINRLARRSAGIRFVYSIDRPPPSMIRETFQTLHRQKPDLILVPPYAIPLEREVRPTWLADHGDTEWTPPFVMGGRSLPPEVEDGLDRLAADYALQGTVGQQGWSIYRPRP